MQAVVRIQAWNFLLNYKFLDNTQFQLSSYFSGAMNAFRFKEFIEDTVDYSGNQLTGVPESQFNWIGLLQKMALV
jgi:iron complex outermembrane receptor protein